MFKNLKIGLFLGVSIASPAAPRGAPSVDEMAVVANLGGQPEELAV